MNTAQKKNERSILIVEDEAISYSIIANALMDLMNEHKLMYPLRRATSLEDAKTQWREHSPVAISLDMQFPLGHGKPIDLLAGAKLYGELLSPKSSAYRSLSYRNVAFCSGAKVADTRILLVKNGTSERLMPAIYSKGVDGVYKALARTLLSAASGIRLG